MSAEDLRNELARAVKRAVADGVPPEDIDAVLDDMQDRVDSLRIIEEGSA